MGVPPVAYLRKSVVRQDDPNNSAEAQEAAVRAMAARHGDAEGLVVLSDWDKSGRLGRAKRPGYDLLWQSIESGAATVIYIYSMSRLARSVSELTRLFETCQERGIPVRLEADVVDTSTASGRMTATILASVAAFESDVAGERLRSANAAKVARGESLRTSAFYGEKPGEDTDAVLAAFAEAGSYSGAARLLNARGVKTSRSRRAWWPSSVHVIIKRLDPSVLPRRPARGAAAGPSKFILGRLLQCPTCGTLLSGDRDRGGRRIRYSCRLGSALPHQRASISERLILPAIQAEAAHLRTPSRVSTEVGDDAKRTALNARRLRIIDLFEAGIIDRADRDSRLAAVTDAVVKLEVQSAVLDVPNIDWGWPPATLNKVLRLVFTRIDLDPLTFQPVAFKWNVPRMRSR